MSQIDIDTLNELIAICEDGVDAFQLAIEHVSEQSLQIKFGELEGKYAAAVGAMKRRVEDAGEQPAQGGTVIGSMHRLFSGVKLGLAGDQPGPALEVLRQSHATALEHFREALDRALSVESQKLVELHYWEIERTGFHTI